MNESELVRTQVTAAIEYVNRTHNEYKLDLRSCRFWARFIKVR